MRPGGNAGSGSDMISYIKGILQETGDGLVVVETGSGVGVNIRVPLSVLENLPRTGEEVLVYTYLKVTEDALTLYGFLTRQDLEIFRRLINVSGIGPKGALSILSVMAPDDLRLAIVTGDAKSIAKAPGIGPKTAQRLILELKEKISLEEMSYRMGDGGRAASRGAQAPSAVQDAIEGLVQLGYSLQEAGKAVRSVEQGDTMDSGALLKAALKTFRL